MHTSSSLLSFKSFIIETLATGFNDKLNPALWNGFELKNEVREHLLMYAEAWRKFSNIPRENVIDIIMTGSNANYNYTNQSDIDVHLIIDRNTLGQNRNIIDDYLANKKALWSLKHNIAIYGFPVEPYAQDVSENYSPTQGVFSLQNNSWIQKPTKIDLMDNPAIHIDTSHYMNKIDSLIKSKANKNDFVNLRKEIKQMRVDGLHNGGEYSHGNLVFKSLRNAGYFDKMNSFLNQQQDRDLSLS